MLIKFITKIIATSLVLGLLSGCGGGKWYRDRSQDYVNAKTTPTIKIPKGTECGSFSEEYQIPELK